MKTADPLRGLHPGRTDNPEGARDRLLCTALTAKWRYTSAMLASMRPVLRCARPSLKTFASTKQVGAETLYAMGRARWNASARSTDRTRHANKHCLLVDLSRFGQDIPTRSFVPTDEPSGHIEARVEAESLSAFGSRS